MTLDIAAPEEQTGRGGIASGFSKALGEPFCDCLHTRGPVELCTLDAPRHALFAFLEIFVERFDMADEGSKVEDRWLPLEANPDVSVEAVYCGLSCLEFLCERAVINLVYIPSSFQVMNKVGLNHLNY